MASHDDDSASPAHWEVLDEKLHADCKVYRVFEAQCRHPRDGRTGTFYVMKAPDWVQVLALTPERELVLVHQYRQGSRRLSWEVPGGVIDPGEDALSAGLRELREETGYTGEKARIIGSVMPNPALQDNHSHFLLVENCELTHPTALDAHEEIEVATLPVEDVIRRARTGEIHHAITLNGLFYLQAELD